MLDWIYNLLGTMLSWFSNIFFGKYALALFLYALLFKLLFLPAAIKQQKSQIIMAKIAPKMEKIQAKYRGKTDEASIQKQQQEIMELQQKEGFRPLSGCLTMFLQLPVITFLYKVIRSPLSYICKLTGEEITKIKDIITAAGITPALDEIGLVANIQELGVDAFAGIDLTKLPDFTLFGANLAQTPSFSEFSILWLVPILAAALTWLSSYLMRKWNNVSTAPVGNGEVQGKSPMNFMEIMMPLMTLWMTFSFSGMLGVYWIYQSVLGILQSFILSKALPIPKRT
ncbi:MAG: YidC/Oxa1 family membrane protein insertase [Eubacteriales bacterium]|nr:YidC/Oxa1 family membrane protein insertase [Eubacteriales bacterium]